ncbi:MAG: hypothetical protein LLG04_03215 [Parachlamydia sp.]|nr:hypothetical protein [Parachlamydia sp.]
MVAPGFGMREPLDRHLGGQRPGINAPTLGAAAPRPALGPVMGNIPIGVMQHQAQAAKSHRAVHLQQAPAPAPVPVVGRALPHVVAPMANPPVPFVGRGLPATVGVVPTAPVVYTAAPVAVARPAVFVPAQQQVVIAPSPRRHFHVIPNTWTPVVSFAVAVLGIAVFAAVLAPEAALIIFPAALLIAISSVAIKAILGK